MNLAALVALAMAPGSYAKDAEAAKQARSKDDVKTEAPVYVPPEQDAPVNLIGGGTRGQGSDDMTIAALAPLGHVALTLSTQPTLYWYVSAPAGTRVDVTVNRADAVEPLLELERRTSAGKSIDSVSLSEQGIRLEAGVEYEWYAAIVPDSEARSLDIVTGGLIKRVTRPGLSAELEATPIDRAAQVLARNGIWYDALRMLSERIDAGAGDGALRQMRVDFLESGGLVQVAASMGR